MTAPPPREEIKKELLRAEKSLQAAQLLLKGHILKMPSPGPMTSFCMQHGLRS